MSLIKILSLITWASNTTNWKTCKTGCWKYSVSYKFGRKLFNKTSHLRKYKPYLQFLSKMIVWTVAWNSENQISFFAVFCIKIVIEHIAIECSCFQFMPWSLPCFIDSKIYNPLLKHSLIVLQSYNIFHPNNARIFKHNTPLQWYPYLTMRYLSIIDDWPL